MLSFRILKLGFAIGALLIQAELTNALAPAEPYDYIVVGSGPGGGPLACNLARSGYKTLLLEAGEDESDDLGTVIANLATGAANASWGFFVRHHLNDETELKNNQLTWRFPNGTFWVGNGDEAPEDAELAGVYYPRGATLGGSSIVNAMATFLPHESDWDNVMEITGDKSWSHANLRRIFKQIEHNNYLPRGTPGHGFRGYFETNLDNGTQYLNNPGLVEVIKTNVRQLGKDPNKVIDMLGSDVNYLSPTRDTDVGLWGLPFHASKRWERFSSRTYILETLRAVNRDGSKKYPLTLSLQSLATKIIFDRKAGRKPKAIGVHYLKGQSLYQADPRYKATTKGQRMEALASKEVVISGGAFNSPQLLQLSGIGAKKDLEKLGIKVVVDLPGVGRSLQDNQEMPVVARTQINPSNPPNPDDPQCTFGAPGDPCVALWLEGKGPYMRTWVNTNAMVIKSNHTVNKERDMFVFTILGAFRGFWPPVQQPDLIDPPTTVGWSMVKMMSQNRGGWVKLRSVDPTAPPEINFAHYTTGADIDLGAMMDTIAFARRVMRKVPAPYGPLEPVEPPCPDGPDATGSCGEVDRQWIITQTFGHHPVGTCAIGREGDRLAVLDSHFQVHGVSGLRVVDASAFPRTPGAFPVVATFMLSQKASEVMLEKARKT